MDFRRLTLKDWLVYGGELTLNFPAFQPGSNLIVIHGRNGYGKTSLMRALQFVFHGGVNRDDLADSWNEHARAKRQGRLEVSLDFVNHSRTGRIVRYVDFEPRGSASRPTLGVKLFLNDHEELDQVEDKIQQLIPRDCGQFVFFDGAEITRYARKQHEDGVREAIEQVLGIPAVRNLRTDLTRLISVLEDEQQDMLRAKGMADNLLERLQDLRSEEASTRERRTHFTEQRKAISETLDKLDKESGELHAIDAERKRLDDTRRRKADYEERRKTIEANIEQAVSQAPLLLVIDPLTHIIQDMEVKMGTPSRSVRAEHLKVALEELLSHDDCFCGKALDDQAVDVIRTHIAKLDGQITTNVRERGPNITELGSLKSTLKRLRSSQLDGKALVENRARLLDSIEEIEQDIADLEQHLRGHDVVEIRELYQQIGTYKSQSAELDEKIRALESNLDSNLQEQKDVQRQIDEMTIEDQRGTQVTRILGITRKLLSAVNEMVDDLVEGKRVEIERRASEIFHQITNKPQEYAHIRVKPDYSLEVVRVDGSAVENDRLSAGEKEVLAYSFITALNLTGENPVPFVMDTPFGHLDAGHREGLLKSLPNLGVQVLLLATDRDLPAAERDAISSTIAEEYVIKRNQLEARSYFEGAP